MARGRKMKTSDESVSSAFGDCSVHSQIVDLNIKTIFTSAVNVDADNVQNGIGVTRVPGYIFMCNSKTKPDCFVYRVFGLPASRMADVEKIMPNTKLFLYDFNVRLLYGLYVADSGVQLAIEPYAFEGRFPAQVKFSIVGDCLPLPEVAFKEAISENYTGGFKFKQELSEAQVTKLVSLFRPITIRSPPWRSSVFHGAVESPHPAHEGPNLSSLGQYAVGSVHTNMHLNPSSSHIQEAPLPPLRLAHNEVAVPRNYALASQPFHSQSSYLQRDPAHFPEAYNPDHSGLYQQDTHSQYGAMGSHIASANSYYDPNSMIQSHISHQQSQAVAPSSSMSAAQWVAMASETRGQTTSSTDYYGQSQGGTGAGTAYMHYNATSSAPLASEYQYQGYQTSHQVNSAAMAQQVVSNVPSNGSEAHVIYQTSVLSGYPSQVHPTTQPSLASADPGAGYAHSYYAGTNPTY